MKPAALKILVATNAFKGTLGPARAANIIGDVISRLVPRAKIEIFPVSDGGDGLIETFASQGGSVLKILRTSGPVLKPVSARWLLSGNRAVLEMAEASGIKYLSETGLAPLDASSFGVGKLLRAALRCKAKTVFVGLGGSASNDGGAGCAQGFGFKLLDKNGRDIRSGARGLPDLARIIPPPDWATVRKLKVVALADVSNPLCGMRGSARVYGPQKGAGPAEVKRLEKALLWYAGIVRRELGIDVRSVKGGAAAGGLGAGLYAFFGATLLQGCEFIFKELDFKTALNRNDCVVTGEGRFDSQSFYGKAPAGVAIAAKKAGKPVLLVCGSLVGVTEKQLQKGGIDSVLALDKYLPLSELKSKPAPALEKALLQAKPALTSFFQCKLHWTRRAKF